MFVEREPFSPFLSDYILPSLLFIHRQRLHQVIEAQPKTPTVMEECHGEENGYDEKHRQDTFITRACQY